MTSDIDQSPIERGTDGGGDRSDLRRAVPGTLTGEADPERALRMLRRRTGMFCVTLGARGSMLLDGISCIVCRPPVRAWTPPAPATCFAAGSSTRC